MWFKQIKVSPWANGARGMNEQFKVPLGKFQLCSCNFILVVRCEGVPSAIFFFIKFMKLHLLVCANSGHNLS
jgi:hypothetical protein